MTNAIFRDDVSVELIDYMGDDYSLAQAAWISTNTEVMTQSEEKVQGLLNFLMRDRHGTPFEHGSMTFRIEAPIFVFREFQRHRVGWSYNEESGRYTQLKPAFYVPTSDRPLVQVGKPGAYTFEPGSASQVIEVDSSLRSAAWLAYRRYERLLDIGVAREVARMVLPVNIYSSMYATCNPRSLMHFLSLRTKDERAKVPSFPQHEIELVAREMEAHFFDLFPYTYEAFNTHGRQAP